MPFEMALDQGGTFMEPRRPGHPPTRRPAPGGAGMSVRTICRTWRKPADECRCLRCMPPEMCRPG